MHLRRNYGSHFLRRLLNSGGREAKAGEERICDGAKAWNYKGVKVWRCESVKVGMASNRPLEFLILLIF